MVPPENTAGTLLLIKQVLPGMCPTPSQQTPAPTVIANPSYPFPTAFPVFPQNPRSSL